MTPIIPPTNEILVGLERIVAHGVWVAIAWHFVAAVVLAGLLLGWRPRNRTAMVLLIAPTVSVSALAFGFGNPFNGVMFALLALILATITAFVSAESRTQDGRIWEQLLGVGLVLFGWIYPHFVVGHTAVHYAIAAPLGTIPCPTLALLAGATLYANGFGSRAWCWSIALATAFYGIIGVIRLHVWVDLALFVAVGALAAQAIRLRREAARETPPLRHLHSAILFVSGVAPQSGSQRARTR